MRKHGVLSFHFVGDPTILEVHVFVVPDFAGELQESEEMAPQWFALDADLYVGEASFVRVEAEYEGLITNRIIVVPSLELDVPLVDDPALNRVAFGPKLEIGMRVSYDLIDRLLSPYVGLHYERTFGGSADLVRVGGEDASAAFLVIGARIIF